MKKTTLRKIPDNDEFRLSTKKGSVWYVMNRKERGKAMFTSTSSGMTFIRPLTTTAYLIIKPNGY